MKFLFVAILTFAASKSFVNFNIAGKAVKFYKYPEQRITSSLECDSIEKEKLCPELKFLETLDYKKIKQNTGGGINMGSLLCNDALSGIVVMGTTASGNQNSFCKIQNLYVDSGTLVYYANKNSK